MTIFKKNKNQNPAGKEYTKKREYIPLQEAAKFCNYSSEYLSLRARQRKLKAIKIGRDWMTKEEWVKDYVKKAEEYKNNLKVRKVKKAPPPKNLPVEPLPIIDIFLPRFVLVVGLIFIVFTISFVFGKDFLDNTYAILKLQMLKINQNADIVIAKASIPFVENLKEYSQWLKETFRKLPRAISQLFKKPEKVAKEGMVVIPSTEKDEETKEKIKKAFSDEVRIEVVDKTSGIITPIFREREGGEYLYLLVPIKN